MSKQVEAVRNISFVDGWMGTKSNDIWSLHFDDRFKVARIKKLDDKVKGCDT